MKKILATLLMTILASQSTLLAETMDAQKEALQQTLTLRFKHETLKSIKENYEKELNVLEAQYARNKQIEDFQKRQRPDAIRTAVYTSPFPFITDEEWKESLIGYANQMSVTKVPRRNSTEIIFHFPEVSTQFKNRLETYRLEVPTLKVISVLLSSGKLIEVDKNISPKISEQSITLETDNASILKINLLMDYQVPNDNSAKTILTAQSPTAHGMTLLPSFDSVVLLQLDSQKAESIIHIDAQDARGNTLATKTPEKVNNVNDLSTQAIRIDLLKGFVQAIENKDIKNQKEAVDYFLKHSEAYLKSSNNTNRQLTKGFSGIVDKVIIYTAEEPMPEQYSFSIY